MPSQWVPVPAPVSSSDYKKVTITFFDENALFPHPKNSDLSVSSHVYRNNSEKLFAGGAGVAEKTSLELSAVGDERISTYLKVR